MSVLTTRKLLFTCLAGGLIACAGTFSTACSSADSSLGLGGSGGVAGSDGGGSGGVGGTAGSGGTGGTAGSGGTGGTAGSGGTGGTAGSGGGTAGTGGTAGSGGTGGTAGSGGTGGTAGSGGTDGGTAGSGGTDGGTAGSGGTDGGTAGSGGTDGGTAGSGGTGGADGGIVNLYFSEYVEGTANNKALEIYNAGGSAMDLSTCVVNIYSNGSSSVSNSITLTGTVGPDGTFVICNAKFALGNVGAICQQKSSKINFNGDDAVELVCATTMDVIGQIGVDPGKEWGDSTSDAAPLVTTQNHTLRRKCSVTTGDTNGSDVFDPTVQWIGFAQNTIDGLGHRSCPGNP